MTNKAANPRGDLREMSEFNSEKKELKREDFGGLEEKAGRAHTKLKASRSKAANEDAA